MQQSEETEADKDKAGNSGTSPTVKKENAVKQEKGVVKKEAVVKTEKEHRDAQRAKEGKIAENEIIRDLKAQLK